MGYYHFVVESGLPQLFAFRALGLLSDSYGLPVLVYDKPFVRNALQLLGVPMARTVFVEPSEIYFAHELYVLGNLGPDVKGIVLAAAGTLRAVRQAMLSLVPVTAMRPRQTVYVRRSAASKRSVSNEDALLRVIGDSIQPNATLQMFDASTKAAPHTLAEQIRTFRDADLVVGVHGAAMTNLLWMERQDSAVLYFGPRDAEEAQGGTLGDIRCYACGG